MRLAPGAMHGRLAVTSVAAPVVVWGVLAGTAHAAENTDAAARVIACVDPSATLVLNSSAAVARHSARWITERERRGRCFAVNPSSHWEPIHRSGVLLLMRLSPPQPGLPPLYFRIRKPPAPAVTAARRERAKPGSGIAAAAAAPLPVPAAPSPPPGGGGIREQALPPLFGPSPPAPPLLRGGSAKPPSGLLPSGSVGTTPPVRPERPPSASLYWSRGYDLGIAVFVLLLILLLAVLGWLLRGLLGRRARMVETQAAPEPEAVPSPALPTGARAPGLRAASITQIMQLRRGDTKQAGAGELPAQAPAPAGPTEQADTHQRWVDLLRDAGWQAVIHAASEWSRADVVARRDGRVLALKYVSAADALDEEAVEEACMAREREQADLVGIVSDAAPTAGASKLATEAGIHLLRGGELPGFIR